MLEPAGQAAAGRQLKALPWPEPLDDLLDRGPGRLMASLEAVEELELWKIFTTLHLEGGEVVWCGTPARSPGLGD